MTHELGGYFQELKGVKYLADPTERKTDEEYRKRLKGKAIANWSSGNYQDVWRFITTGYGQTNPTVGSTEVGGVNVTIAQSDIMTQGDRYIAETKGPVTAGIGFNVDNWTFEYIPFNTGLDNTSDIKIDQAEIDSKDNKIYEWLGTERIVQDATFFVNSSNFAYGTWNWWFSKTTASSVDLVPIMANNEDPYATANSGYAIRLDTVEAIVLRRLDLGGTSTNLFATGGAAITTGFHKFTLTRTIDGIFTMYLDDVLITPASGTNPVTDNTYNTSSFQAVSGQIGDRMGLVVFDDDTKLTTYEGPQ